MARLSNLGKVFGVSRARRLGAAAGVLWLLPLVPAAPAGPKHPVTSALPREGTGHPNGGQRRLISEQNGVLQIRDGARVRVSMELGDVHVLTQSSGEVKYHLRVEGRAGEPESKNDRGPFTISSKSDSEGVALSGRMVSSMEGPVWVALEVNLPRNTPLEVNTQGGKIEVQDIENRVTLVTAGGDLTVGHVGGAARLETAGGHITVQDVAGELNASTGGGHINAGKIHGDCVLRSGGGHLRVAAVDGTARVETGGGNVFIQQAGARLNVSTGGGSIIVGEASAGVQARTGGGGIRILRMAGPTEVETGGGAILLSRVQGRVRASTGAGGITAWFANPALSGKPLRRPEKPPRGGEQLAELDSSNGDIVVYLPRDLGVNIEAIVANPVSFRIYADPALPVKITSGEPGRGAIRAEGALNGGGALVRLRAEDGNIRLRFADIQEPPLVLEEPRFSEGIEKSLVDLQQKLEQQRQLIERLCEIQQKKFERQLTQHKTLLEEPQRELVKPEPNPDKTPDKSEERLQKPESLWADRVKLPGDELEEKLVYSVSPIYPERARVRHVQGSVRLRVIVGTDGTVQDVKILSGHPYLIQAAVDAVKQWRYEPTLVDGKAVAVVSVVTVEFRRP